MFYSFSELTLRNFRAKVSANFKLERSYFLLVLALDLKKAFEMIKGRLGC